MKTALRNAVNRFKLTHISVRVTCYLLLGYAIYALLLGLALPAIIQSQAPQKLSEMLGRDVEIAEVKIDPFALRVEVNGFAIAEQDKSANFISLGQVRTEFNFWQSIAELTPTLEYFHLVRPEVRVARLSTDEKGTTFNFSDILQHLAAQQEQNAQEEGADNQQEEAGEIFAFRAHTITLTNGQIDIRDKKTGVKLGYQDIGFNLQELDTRALTLSQTQDSSQEEIPRPLNPAANIYTLSLAGRDESQFTLNGQFQLPQLETKGEISLSHLQLVPFWPLSEQIIEASLTRGEASFSSAFHLKEKDGEITFASSQGDFSLADITFEYQDAERIKLNSLALKAITVDTNSQKIALDSLSLNQLWVDAELTKNGVDLQKYFTPKLAGTKPSEDTPNSVRSEQIDEGDSDESAWLVQLDRFEMMETDLNLRDKLVSDGVFWRVYPLNIATGTLFSNLSQPIDYELDLQLGSEYKQAPQRSRGGFASSGNIDVPAMELNSQLQLTGLELNQLQPYLDPYVNIILSKGSLSTSGTLTANSKGKAIFNGQSAIDQLLIKDVIEREPLVKWKKMSIDSLNFDQAAKALKINTVLLNEPYAKVLIAKDKRTNVGEISKKGSSGEEQGEAVQPEPVATGTESAPSQNTNTASGEEFAVDIAKIEIVDGSAFFADYSLTPNFASGIELMEGYIKHISSDPATRARVDIKGKIDRYAPVALSGEVNPLSIPPYLDLDFSLESAELTSVNPYSGTYAGYYIDKGQLSLDINYRLEDGLLEGSNHVVVDQLTLGKRSDSELATTLPVTLAVGLLKDSDGVIDLGFDVSGDINNPEFSFGSAILKVVVNIITKAVTAPFSMLADLVGSDDDLDMVEFAAGVATLDSVGENRLAKLSEALKSRPNLKVSVEGSVLAVEDSRVLAEARLQQKLLQTSGLTELPEDLSASRIPQTGALPTALEQLFVQELQSDIVRERDKVTQMLADKSESGEPDPKLVTETLHIGIYNQLVSAQEITEHDLGKLAESRARAVKTYMVENEIKPGRVFILDSKTKLKTEQRQAVLTIDAG